MKKNRYSFHLGTGKNNFFKTIMLTGMCRVGKTLLGNIISTCKNVEYAEEPYFLQFFPLIQQGGNVSNMHLNELWQGYLTMLFQDIALLRAANFRQTDLSYIGNKKTQEEIKFRFSKLHNMHDVAAKLSNNLFVINIAESCFAYKELCELSKNAPLIYVIRHPNSVALDVYKKGWLTDEYLQNNDVLTPVKICKENGEKYIVPFWVGENMEDFFLSLNTQDRAFYYWYSFAKKYLEMKKDYSQILHTFTYENITHSPREVYAKLCDIFSFEHGELTERALSKVYITETPKLEIINSNLRHMVADINAQINLGYIL